jgi:hypothetical protein
MTVFGSAWHLNTVDAPREPVKPLARAAPAVPLNPQMRAPGDVKVGWWHAPLDDLAGAREQRGRHLDPECPRGLQVDDQANWVIW